MSVSVSQGLSYGDEPAPKSDDPIKSEILEAESASKVSDNLKVAPVPAYIADAPKESNDLSAVEVQEIINSDMFAQQLEEGAALLMSDGGDKAELENRRAEEARMQAAGDLVSSYSDEERAEAWSRLDLVGQVEALENQWVAEDEIPKLEAIAAQNQQAATAQQEAIRSAVELTNAQQFQGAEIAKLVDEMGWSQAEATAVLTAADQTAMAAGVDLSRLRGAEYAAALRGAVASMAAVEEANDVAAFKNEMLRMDRRERGIVDDDHPQDKFNPVAPVIDQNTITRAMQAALPPKDDTAEIRAAVLSDNSVSGNLTRGDQADEAAQAKAVALFGERL